VQSEGAESDEFILESIHAHRKGDGKLQFKPMRFWTGGPKNSGNILAFNIFLIIIITANFLSPANTAFQGFIEGM